MPAIAGIFVCMTTLLAAHNLSRRFGSQQAVSDFSLQLQRGQVLGLLGPNGAGKTTSLRMLSGCLSPDSGQIQINGLDLARQPQAAKAQLGYLPETPPLHNELRVDEFLRFAAGLRGLRGSKLKQAQDYAVQTCDLGAVRRRIIGSLSKGYRQRVGLAQALIHQPPLIILDEPTDGLDPNQLLQVRQLIRKLTQEHAVLLSSHMLSEVQAVCDQVAIMNRGRLVKHVDLDDLNHTTDGPHWLHLQLARPPAHAELEKLPGVVQLQALPAGQYRINSGDQDIREALVQHAAQHHWGLLELRREGPSLESIFAELSA